IRNPPEECMRATSPSDVVSEIFWSAVEVGRHSDLTLGRSWRSVLREGRCEGASLTGGLLSLAITTSSPSKALRTRSDRRAFATATLQCRTAERLPEILVILGDQCVRSAGLSRSNAPASAWHLGTHNG